MKKISKNYLDISRMFEDKTVVFCYTARDAETLLNYLKAHYPDRVASWDEKTTHFNSTRKFCGYTFFNTDGTENSGLMQSPYEDTFFSHGYNVIPFEDLIAQPDISESDQDIALILN